MTAAPPMGDQLEVHFCDLCNASVPQQDLDAGTAARVKDRIVGACCLQELQRGSPDARGSRTGIAAAAVVLMAAIAGAAMFVDWRLSAELGRVQDQLAALEDGRAEQQERLRGIEERLATTVTRPQLETLRGDMAELGRGIGAAEATVRGSLDGTAGRLDALSARVAQIGEEQGRQLTGVDGLRDELREVKESVAAALAEARTMQQRREPPPPAPSPASTPEAAPAEAGSALPAEVAAQIAALEDPDPGTRFEAVDKLIQSKHAGVVDALVAMTKDSDLFVRRLTVEGLGQFRQPASVDALIGALGDDEELVRHTAYASLQKLTGENIAFDPAARAEERRNAQRRWQEWWSKNRDAF